MNTEDMFFASKNNTIYALSLSTTKDVISKLNEEIELDNKLCRKGEQVRVTVTKMDNLYSILIVTGYLKQAIRSKLDKDQLVNQNYYKSYNVICNEESYMYLLAHLTTKAFNNNKVNTFIDENNIYGYTRNKSFIVNKECLYAYDDLVGRTIIKYKKTKRR